MNKIPQLKKAIIPSSKILFNNAGYLQKLIYVQKYTTSVEVIAPLIDAAVPLIEAGSTIDTTAISEIPNSVELTSEAKAKAKAADDS